ncbi:MAG: hypothetical protein QXG39_04815 [Candidatus Aenigmatarchaeota archaeon]
MLIDEKTKVITEILKRVVASGFVKNAYPLSAILIAPVGAGKTTQLKKIAFNKNILALSDVTPYGLSKLLPEIKARDVRHLIIFDLVEPFSRSRTIVNNLIGFLNSLIEEGIFRIQTAFIEIKEPIKLGLITSTTEKEFLDKRRGWLGIGFISRMLPISFSYTNTDVIKILEDLANQKYQDIKYETLKLKEKEIKENPAINQKLIPYAQSIDKKLPEIALPFRRLQQLKILLMANALLNDRKEVTEEDFEFFKSVSNWINFDFNPL